MNILEAKNITKMFPGVIALDSVDIAFELGEIHAIHGLQIHVTDVLRSKYS